MKVYFLKCPFCKDRAFTFKRKPYQGMVLKKKDVVETFEGNIIKCKSCSSILFGKHLSLENLGEQDEPECKE